MTDLQLSESVEMYLKALAELNGGDAVSISKLAERLNVSPVSANEMVKKLTEQTLAAHAPYKGVTLTKKGRAAAADVIRRQRLWEVFLYNHLHIDWAQIYELACALEHATAPEVTAALANFLGDPQTCPRGNPIPDARGAFRPLGGIALSEANIGASFSILAINATSTDALKYLQERNILPGRQGKILEAAPLDGTLTLQIESKTAALGLSLAQFVIIKEL